MTPTYEEVCDQVAVLQSRLEQLTGTPELRDRVRQTFKLSPKQAAIITLLLKTRRPVTAEMVYANVFEHPNGDGPEQKIIAVTVCQLRSRLRALDAPGGISSSYGTGAYTITDDLRAWLNARLEVA